MSTVNLEVHSRGRAKAYRPGTGRCRLHRQIVVPTSYLVGKEDSTLCIYRNQNKERERVYGARWITFGGGGEASMAIASQESGPSSKRLFNKCITLLCWESSSQETEHDVNFTASRLPKKAIISICDPQRASLPSSAHAKRKERSNNNHLPELSTKTNFKVPDGQRIPKFSHPIKQRFAKRPKLFSYCPSRRTNRKASLFRAKTIDFLAWKDSCPLKKCCRHSVF